MIGSAVTPNASCGVEAGGRESWQRVIRAGLAVVWLAACPAVMAIRPPRLDGGFLACRDTSLEGESRLRILGPIYESRSCGEARFRALRPFYYDEQALAESRRLREYLWPAGSVRNRDHSLDWRFVFAYGSDFDTEDPGSRRRTWIMPVVFMGRDRNGADYFAVFPLGGTLREFWGRDTISFVLFPLYSRSTLHEISTWNVLWPLISGTEGEDLHRFRVFPFYGHSVKKGRYDKTFVLWPIWTHSRYMVRNGSGTAWMLFPVAGRIRMENQEGWMVLPPFIRWTRGPTICRGMFPWPFVQYSSGKEEKLYFWPLAGRKTTADSRYQFLIWPIFSQWEGDRGEEHIRRVGAAPLVFSERRTPPGTPEASAHSACFKLWPLFWYERKQDRSFWRTLDLWPVPRSEPIERNFAPFWSLYTHRRTGAQTEDELLWGLWRHRRGEEGAVRASFFPLVSWSTSPENRRVEEWSVLKGLVARDRGEAGVSYRLLYFLKFGRGGEP